MELKDVILSTLDEIDSLAEKVDTKKSEEKPVHENRVEQQIEQKSNENFTKNVENLEKNSNENRVTADSNSDEEKFLLSVKERLLVLFEGFQSPNNVQIDAKIDMTLNFLEYLLATIESRVETIQENKSETKRVFK